jgi:hypothetical protein
MKLKDLIDKGILNVSNQIVVDNSIAIKYAVNVDDNCLDVISGFNQYRFDLNESIKVSQSGGIYCTNKLEINNKLIKLTFAKSQIVDVNYFFGE